MQHMHIKDIDQYIAIYRQGLLENIVPFWLKHSVDTEYGGFMSCVDRDGSVVDTDKSVWLQGRFSWLLATLYNEVEANAAWLEPAISGAAFLQSHCIDTDRRMFFIVDRQGNPVRKRRYVYAETFASIAFAALYRATGEQRYAQLAREMFEVFVQYSTTPGLIPPKYTQHRPMKGMGTPMIGIVTAQELRKNLNDPSFTVYIDRWIEEIRRDFLREEYKAVMENIGADGSFIDHFDGRTLNPGHAIEGAWFILREAQHRENDPNLVDIGTTMLDWMWEIGWDKEYGGIYYFRDVKGLPVQEYWHDMKFWWPHCEAIIATLMAYQLTGNAKYAQWHTLVHNWSFKHFPDPQYGEWYGYLHRDGRLSNSLKGSIWKGPFHVPRMYLMAWKILESIRAYSRQ
jgi:N-acylglucosamine 2-epimerase